jgi:O-antigen/teichoic acid export membrane protein
MLLEIGGFLFLDMLNINLERMATAYFVFHCVAAITFFSITSTPYQALINAKEDMSYMAAIAIIEVFAKLGIALFLFSSPYDRLETYAVAMMLLAILMRIIQRLFCRFRYTDVFFSLKFIDKELLKKMLAFSGWNFFENICAISKNQGLPILVNLFFGTAMNAVLNITMQVTANISKFSIALSITSAPQIVSGIADEKLEHSKILAVSSCKFQMFLVSLLGIPLFLNVDYVLLIWLKNVPEYLSVFCCLALINEFTLNFSRGLQSLIEGRGYIRGFKIAMGFSNLIVLPIAYIFLKIGYPPYIIYVSIFVGSIFIAIFQIYFARRHVSLSISHFLKEMSKILATALLTFSCVYLFFILNSQFSILNSSLAILLISTMLSTFLMCSGLWLALNQKERDFAKGLLKKMKINMGYAF